MLQYPHCSSGYSLLELLVVLLIVAILSVVNYPGLAVDLHQAKLRAEKKKLLSVLNFARQYAVLHHRSVMVCGNGHADDCDGGWSKAWLFCVGQQPKHKWEVYQPGLRVDWRGSFGRKKQLTFDDMGYPRGAHGRFVLSYNGSPRRLYLIVSPSGIVR